MVKMEVPTVAGIPASWLPTSRGPALPFCRVILGGSCPVATGQCGDARGPDPAHGSPPCGPGPDIHAVLGPAARRARPRPALPGPRPGVSRSYRLRRRKRTCSGAHAWKRGWAARWPGPPVAGEADLGPDAVGDRHGDGRGRGRGFAVLAAAAATTAGPAATRAAISFPTTATSSGRTGQPLFGCWLVAVRAPGSHQRGYSSTTGTDQAATRFNHVALDSAAPGRSLGERPRPDRASGNGPGLRASRRERGTAAAKALSR